MTETKQIDVYTEIRLEYQKGRKTLKALAEEFQVPASTLYKRKQKEDWDSLPVVDSSPTLLTGNLDRNQQTATRIHDLIDAALAKAPTSSELRYIVQAFKDLMSIQKETGSNPVQESMLFIERLEDE